METSQDHGTTLISATSVTVANEKQIIHQTNYYYNQGVVSSLVTDEERETNVSEFQTAVCDRSRQNVKSSIARDFEGQIPEPKQEVAPTLVRTNFFRGGTVLDEKNYMATTEKRRKVPKKKSREIEVQLANVHKHGRYIMLVGGAGSGKTTLIKRYADMVLKGKVDHLSKVKLVHFINIRDLSKDVLGTKEMLFGKFLLGEHMKLPVKYGYEWLQKEENQEQVLLAFDGIDTAPWFLSNDKYDIISYDDTAGADTIMYNILRGHLFPKCWLLLTSREYGITRFPLSIRPEAVIALKGFTRLSIQTLVKELGGDRGDEIWRSLLNKSLNLMLLCSTPLFLIFTIIMYMKYDNPPENLSGIIITLIESHIHSQHRKVDDENVRDIIEKLKTISLQGLREGRVIFTGKEFTDQKLDLNDVKDLVINVPNPADTACTQKLLEEDCSLFFCHQSLQESLAALCVAREDLETFKQFVMEKIHSPNYVVVRQILCGVLFNDETTRLAGKQSQVLELKAKQQCLLETVAAELEKSVDSPMDMLNLLISLRECGENREVAKMVQRCIPKINLSGIPLTPNDLHATASVARHCKALSIMQLVNCHMDNYGLEVLANAMKGSDVEILVFDVSFNGNLKKDSMFHLHEICIRGQGLNYWQCGFRQMDILMFNEREAQQRLQLMDALEPKKEEDVEKENIEKSFNHDQIFDLSCYNVEHYLPVLESLAEKRRSKEKGIRVNLLEYEQDSNLQNLCGLLQTCENIRELALSECDLTESQLEKIEESMKGKEIGALNVYLNPSIGDKGWGVLGRIAKNCEARSLFITACSLTEDKLMRFKTALKGSKTQLFKLDISRNDDMDEYCLREIGEIVEMCQVEELVMGYCDFKPAQLQYLKRAVRQARINRIDLSGNDKMGEDGYYALGEMVYKCKVQLLDVSECDPTASEVGKFKEATHDAKVHKLNVSRNRNMGVEGLRDVGRLVGKCKLNELFIRQCNLQADTLRSFKEGLGDATIPFLDMGFYFMKVRRTTDEEIDIVISILANVTEQLTLNDWDISEKGRRDLQKALDSLPYRDLKIQFNRGKNDLITQKKPVV